MADEMLNMPDTQFSQPGFRLARPSPPVVALGLAVQHLMDKDAFREVGFAAAARAMMHCIERGWFVFVADEKNVIQGFVTWVLATREGADHWLAHDQSVPVRKGDVLDCLIMNAWSVNTPAATRFLVNRLHEVQSGINRVYFKRYYPNGNVRRVSLGVAEARQQILSDAPGMLQGGAIPADVLHAPA
jgi:hypothetical protein